MTTPKPTAKSGRSKPAPKAKKAAPKAKKAAPKAKKAAPKAKPSVKRVTRPVAERMRPDRSGARAAEQAKAKAAAQSAPAPDPQSAPPSSKAAPSKATQIDEAVAQAVKSGYDVLAKTIAQSRESATRFRQGEYNMRDVPQDVQNVTLRLLDLARQLSATTLDLCEQLVMQIGNGVGAGPPPPGEVASKMPPFRSHEPQSEFGSPPIEGGEDQQSLRAAPPPQSAGGIPISIVFDGTKKAKALNSSLSRPVSPTGTWQISAAPLASREGNATPIENVSFSSDLSEGTLVATIKVPKGQPPGTYSGLVFAETQPVPLGMLVIEIGS
ncbi:hypothetical protein [Altererythrobacter sp.]|uniref:hypothetical protein n=1 Tax=Altererythrobacter sp. TaxID=1872480 RepID=UPI003D02AE01